MATVDVDDMGIRLKYSEGAFNEAVVGIRYTSQAGVADWTRVVIPILFYGAKLRKAGEDRVFIVGADEGLDGLPPGVYCWEKDMEFTKRLFEYSPLRSALGIFHVIVMPFIHARGWIEARPIGKYPDPLLMIWFLSALNMAWYHAIGGQAKEIFPVKELLSKKSGEES
ncbi:MAG: hypothetical protein ACP5UU_05195 [Thermoprotei archaeon]